MKTKLRLNQQGLTLLEILIAMAMGLIILSAALGIFVSMIKADTDNVKTIQLNQELRGAMSLMTRDIRRAGANQNAAANATGSPPSNPFSVAGGTRLTIEANPQGDANSCITYSYDSESPFGTSESSEKYGFRLDPVDHTVETRNGDNACSATSGWLDLTDKNLVNITGLSFTDTTVVQAGINIRQITITLSGYLARDNTITRTITETVKLRNDEF
jgi:prepilin-type N-terminal cleavage/methylation domain-containing protein